MQVTSPGSRVGAVSHTPNKMNESATSANKEKEVVIHRSARKEQFRSAKSFTIEETKDAGNPGLTTKKIQYTVLSAGDKKKGK